MTAKYASGEEPQVGDVVRFDGGDYHICALSGGVFAVEGVMCFGGRIWIDYGPGYGKLNSSPRCFTLIARAGQPVEYLPGDVVECVEAFSFDGSLRLADQSVGDRFTVDEVIHGNLALNGLTEHDGRKARFAPSRFRLVHRPDAPKVEEGPVVPKFKIGDRVKSSGNAACEYFVETLDKRGRVSALRLAKGFLGEEVTGGRVTPFSGEGELTLIEPPTKPIAEIARDLRPGQKVRVTLEGVVNELGQVIGDDTFFVGKTALPNATSLEIIEDAPPKPLAVGDRVKYALAAGFEGKIKAVLEDRAWIDWGDSSSSVIPLDRLERAA